jgi:Protein of unknown function (DUF3037)
VTLHACQYAIIRFLPYAETGEFANVGVLLACPDTGFFKARLMPVKRTGRITGFFEQLDKRVYREALGYLNGEINRLHEWVTANLTLNGNGVVQQAFSGLVRPRQSLVRFGDARVIMADDPEGMLAKLFARFVERDFADKEYHERIMERSVRNVLTRANLREFFVADDIGNEDLHIHIPFVHMQNGRQKLAIKPLDLAKEEANKVFDFGGHWVDRVRRLKKHALMPDQMLFAVRMPAETEQRTRKAADEIVSELKQEGTQVVWASDNNAIAAFAEPARNH